MEDAYRPTFQRLDRYVVACLVARGYQASYDGGIDVRGPVPEEVVDMCLSAAHDSVRENGKPH